MEVKCISSSVSVSGCGNQRQSSTSPLFDRGMKCLLRSVGVAGLGSAAARLLLVPEVSDAAALYQCH